MHKVCLFWMALALATAAQVRDARNMEIPTDASAIRRASDDADTAKAPALLLHYRIGVLERMTSWMYTMRKDDASPENPGYMGVEPVSFSKPGDGLYQVRLGLWGTTLKRAMSDKPEPRRIMRNYQLRAALATAFLLCGALAGVTTVHGVLDDWFVFGDTRNEHLVNGTGLTAGCLVAWTIPQLFNRGKIHRAAQVYNR